MSFARFRERFVGTATPRALGATRIVICAVLLVSALWEDPASSAIIPQQLRKKMGLLEVLYQLPIGFSEFVSSSTALTLFKWLTVLLLALAAAGVFTRVSIVLSALAYIVLGGLMRQYAWFYHTGLIPLYMLIGLAFTRSGDALSFDAWRRKQRGDPTLPPEDVPAAHYAWARFQCWMLIAIPYLLAGLSKLRDGWPPWWTALNFKRILLGTNVRPMQFDFDGALHIIHAPNWVFSTLGFCAVVSEILYVSVLFSRHARLVFPPTMVFMHIGILVLQNILFFDLILLQLIFVDWDWVFSRFGKQQAAAGAEAGAARTDLRYGVVLSLLASLLLLWWVTDEEYYPFTSMQMFTGSVMTSGRLSYPLIWAHTDSGKVESARIEHYVPAFRDTRYRHIIAMGQGGAKKQKQVRLFLEAVGAEWNRQAEPGERVVEFEIQQRDWDFVRKPDDPERGVVSRSYRFPISAR